MYSYITTSLLCELFIKNVKFIFIKISLSQMLVSQDIKILDIINNHPLCLAQPNEKILWFRLDQ
jgi:hypothetical protein